MYTCTSLNQDGFHSRGVWIDFLPPTSFLVGKISLTSRMRNMWSLIFHLELPCSSLGKESACNASGQGSASSLDCPATDILQFLSTRKELKCFPWWAWGGPSTSYLKNFVISIYKVEGSTRKRFKQLTLKDESFLKLRLTQSSNFH